MIVQENKRLLAAIPCLNEAATIRALVEDIPRVIQGISIVDVLVIDDGSIDQTANEAKAGGATVVSHRLNRGVGSAFQSAVAYAVDKCYDIMINIDGDFQFNPSDIPKLVAPILAGRRINDGMAKFVAEQTVKSLIASGSYVKGAQVNVLGLTFKENCADLRNTKVMDLIRELQSYGAKVSVHDPYSDPVEAMCEYGVKLTGWNDLPQGDAIVAAVSHRQFLALSVADIKKKLVDGGCFIDVKAVFDRIGLEQSGIRVWRL